MIMLCHDALSRKNAFVAPLTFFRTTNKTVADKKMTSDEEVKSENPQEKTTNEQQQNVQEPASIAQQTQQESTIIAEATLPAPDNITWFKHWLPLEIVENVQDQVVAKQEHVVATEEQQPPIEQKQVEEQPQQQVEQVVEQVVEQQVVEPAPIISVPAIDTQVATPPSNPPTSVPETPEVPTQPLAQRLFMAATHGDAQILYKLLVAPEQQAKENPSDTPDTLVDTVTTTTTTTPASPSKSDKVKPWYSKF